MSAPRGHHLVAQLYQRGFAVRSGKAWQIRVHNRRTGDSGLRNVRDVFKRRDWNTIKTEEGELDFAIEELLAKHVDSPAAPAIAALREGNFPLGRDLEVPLSTFMAAQLTRGRMVRENLARVVERSSRQMLSLAAQNYTEAHWQRVLGRAPSPQEKAALIDSEKHFELQPTNALLLDALLSSIDEMAELLARRTWTLVSFEEPCLFTGEHPVIHVTGAEGGYGVVTAEQFHFPVCPSRTLVLSHPWTSWPEGRVNGSRELAERLNWATYVHPANEELLTHPETAAHPLPSLAVLERGGLDWPWPQDPDALPPPSLDYLMQAKGQPHDLHSVAA
jgi:hypothetical protein